MEIAKTAARVLIVDDEESMRTGLRHMISAWGYDTEVAANGQDAIDCLTRFSAQVLITDLMMPEIDGFELLRHLKEQGIQTPAIVLTAFGNIETALATVHDLGAFWFLEKPFEPDALRALLARAVTQSKLTEETERLRRQLAYQGLLGELVGQAAPMLEVFALLRQVAPSRAAVLITGESGTGKELAARSIHDLSPRCTGPYVALNCAALPETLVESELFGDENGAIEGASNRRPGCFELAQHGTLLLDEVCDMPLATQGKLLRVLESGSVRRLGSKREIAVDVRVIAATNKDLAAALVSGQFREDLFYRLNVFQIPLPPLRDRKSDIPLLANALLQDLNLKHGCQVVEVAPDVLERFRGYEWPGNVRELRNILERAMILASKGAITSDHLPSDFGRPVALRKSQPIFGSPAAYGSWAQIFVLMPFSASLRPVFEDHIKSAAGDVGMSAGRADDIFSTGSIIHEVWSAIYYASIIVADCTGRNANVFYEVGIAHTLGRETILIAQSVDDLPFDLRHLRCIIYEYTPRGMKEFEHALRRTLEEVRDKRSAKTAGHHWRTSP